MHHADRGYMFNHVGEARARRASRADGAATVRYLTKPFAADDLCRVVDEGHRRHRDGEWTHGEWRVAPGAAVTMDLADRRRDYTAGALDERDVAADPLTQFAGWYDAAEAAGVADANAATLATVADGRPSARIVLLKGVDGGAFTFFTNWESRKARELDANPAAALVVYWRELERQVRVEGTARRVSADVADAYFATRPRASQLGAWASPQSAAVPDRDTLIRAYRDAERRFGSGPIARPPHWGGYGLTPGLVEFWQGRAGRLHDRICYRRRGDEWERERLAP